MRVRVRVRVRVTVRVRVKVAVQPDLALDLRLHLVHREDARRLGDGVLLLLLLLALGPLLLLELDPLLLLLGQLRESAAQLEVARLLTHGHVRSPRLHGKRLLRSPGRLRAAGLLDPGELLVRVRVRIRVRVKVRVRVRVRVTLLARSRDSAAACAVRAACISSAVRAEASMPTKSPASCAL